MTKSRMAYPVEPRTAKAVMGLAAVVCVAALAACGGSSSSSSSNSATPSAIKSATKSPVTVAVISFKLPTDNELDTIGAGAQGAANVINADGGFGGHPVKIVECNSMLAPGPSDDCAHSTVADHPLAMIGCELSWGETGAVVYAAAQIPSINCLNTPADFKSQWEFGLQAGAAGDFAALATYLCSQPNIKTVVAENSDQPELHVSWNDTINPILTGCGKKTFALYVPPTSVDVAPYMVKGASYHPQFVISQVQNAQVPPSFSALEQNGIPASHIAASDVDFTAATLAAAPQMKGSLDVAEFDPWTLTNLPDVAEYDKAMQGSGVAYKDPSVEWGYSLMMWLYIAAQHVGFAHLSSAALASYMRTANNVAIPLSRDWTNPGPTAAAAIKQPDARILRWTGTSFVPLSGGSDGWFGGLK